MDRKYIETELEKMDWSGMILVIKISPFFTFLFPYSILNIRNCPIFMNHVIDFMFYMEKEKIDSMDFGPFRIILNLNSPNLDQNDFGLTFIFDEYVKDEWNYNYTQKKLNELKIIRNFNAIKGYDETFELIDKVMSDLNKPDNLN